MCSNTSEKCATIFKKLFWIGTKFLLVFGTVSFLVDVGTDVSFSVQLFNNCHVKTGIASLCVILVAMLLSMFLPMETANLAPADPDSYPGWDEMCVRVSDVCLQCSGYLIKYLQLNWQEFIGNELDDDEKVYVHSVKFLETIWESVPQIGLSFYIIHHYGFDEPVFTKYKGDLQMLSLVASFVSINVSMATRRAWWKMLGKPPSYSEIFKCALWNFIPITCFLTAYCIVMADSSLILVIYTCTSPIYSILALIVIILISFWVLALMYLICIPIQILILFCKSFAAFLMDLFDQLKRSFSRCFKVVVVPCLKSISMSRYLAINTFVMASLHTIQVYGLDDDESLHVNSFNICENTTAPENSTSTGELNHINSHKNLFIVIIWSTVIVALLHLIIEAKYATRNEQVFFWFFIVNCEEVSSDPDDGDHEENNKPRTETKENDDK